jgi:rubrerythrin
MSISNDMVNLQTALSLEIAAVKRYIDHQSLTNDPTIFALIQGLMRNESGHEEELVHSIKRLGGDPEEALRLPGPSLPGLVYEGTEVEGQKTNMAMLRADLAFEQEAVKTYHNFASQAQDEEAKKLFIDLTRAEKGHVNGLNTFIKEFHANNRPVAFFCPVCGWEVAFGPAPEVGSESRCRMCGVVWVLDLNDGDYQIGRKP